ncbi:Uncharacterised protein [Mycobacteroides abscessus subsp. massiliense]|nr:Uncharacterised protein [Mycobacteroides abscessus]SHQ57784.1 Uncharacterised protein [Mycobacteroides abscessus subsp. abscessus]SKD43807.1 Uncharacterised protein [Mycobacteroides abscessus subsp. massiliense]CPS25931.1 Uncharacterised protein [Mycobacteroides abscessus]CPS67283.1 Uncharacterised protein [Mycobacteroides abscessus]
MGRRSKTGRTWIKYLVSALIQLAVRILVELASQLWP